MNPPVLRGIRAAGISIFGMLFLSIALFADNAVAEGDCSIADSAIHTASDIRGLRIKRSVPCRLQSRDEVERYLRNAIARKIPEKKLKGEERVFKLLGLIDKNYDYTNGLIALYTDQIGGYYDPEKDYYAMAGWMPASFQMPIAVHELTHALQDQHYNLERFVDDTQVFGDALMARMALVEGDATAVMLDFTRKLQGQGSIAKDKDVSTFIMQNLAGSMLSPGLQSAPPALQALLIFPYVSGLNFVHSLMQRDGFRGIDQAYRNPPRSTEEILHPEKYRTGKKDFVELDAGVPPESIKIKAAEPEFSDTLGEFLISTLLRTYLPVGEAGAASAGWGGDRVALYDRADGQKGDLGVVVWVSAWDSVRDAEEMFTALENAFTKRFGAAPQKGERSILFNTKDFGSASINREESRITVIVGG